MKAIKLDDYSEQIRKSCIDMLEAALKQPVLSQKFNLSIDLKDILPAYTGKADLMFTATAFAKLISMVSYDNREVAVHGSVVRCEAMDPENAGFLVDDIYIYPQEVTSATVEASDAYGYWVAQLPDEIFNRLRFQAHSHVNMGITPSGTDEAFYRKLLGEVQDFYIFLIINKRLDVWCEIYDIENNVLYETADVSTMVVYSDVPDDNSRTFSKTLKELVTTKVYTPTASPESEKKIATGQLPSPTPPTTKTGKPAKNSSTKSASAVDTKKKSKRKYTLDEDAQFLYEMETIILNPTSEQLDRYFELIGARY